VRRPRPYLLACALLAGGAAWAEPTSGTQGTAPATVEAVPPADPSRPADEAADLRIRTLEARVQELKERILRTKARLLDLQDRVVGGELGSGARLAVFHKNDMGGSFVLESAAYALDGAPVFTQVDQGGDLDKRGELQVFAGRVAPGPHQVAVKLVYRGRGAGLFGSAEGWRFKVQSSHAFQVEAGKATTVRVVGLERGGLGVDLKDRPSVRYDVEAQPESPARPPPPARAAANALAGEGGAAR
jgi:hypothetical protein